MKPAASENAETTSDIASDTAHLHRESRTSAISNSTGPSFGRRAPSGRATIARKAAPGAASMLAVKQSATDGGLAQVATGSVSENSSIKPLPRLEIGDIPLGDGESSVSRRDPPTEGKAPATVPQLLGKRGPPIDDERGEDTDDEEKMPSDRRPGDDAGSDSAEDRPSKKPKLENASIYMIIQVPAGRVDDVVLGGTLQSPVTIGIENLWTVADDSDDDMTALLGNSLLHPTGNIGAADLHLQPPSAPPSNKQSWGFNQGVNNVVNPILGGVRRMLE